MKSTLIAGIPALALLFIPKSSLDSIHLAGVSYLWIAAIIIALVVASLMRSPIQFGIAIGGIVAAGLQNQASHGTLYRDRSFFGIYRVASAIGPANILYHGTTIHGAQFTDSARRLLPITYYHSDGPVGAVFRALDSKLPGGNVGIVGLGTGSILCYSKPGEHWTFFEIDPHVAAIARNPRLFTFLSGCQVKPDIVFGDARLTIAREAEKKFSLLVLDAFSSDAIPVHLLTREAMNLYKRVLAADGVIMVHISNRRLDLEPVVGDLAKDAGLEALIQNHDVANSKQNSDYDYGSDWVILARDRSDFGVLSADTTWRAVVTSARGKVWTDDYSNILSVIRW